MLRQFTAPLAAAAHDGLNRGLSALVWTLVVLGLGVTGLGLLIAAAVIGLSQLIGPFLTCGLLGLSFVLLALLGTALRRNRPAALPSPHAPIPAPGQLAFALGFVLARLILEKRAKTR